MLECLGPGLVAEWPWASQSPWSRTVVSEHPKGEGEVRNRKIGDSALKLWAMGVEVQRMNGVVLDHQWGENIPRRQNV